MTENQQQGPGTPPANELPGQIPPEVLKSALKAFKKRLKLTAWMPIRILDAGRFRAGLWAFLRYSRPASFLARCGRNCAGRANCATAGMGCMNW